MKKRNNGSEEIIRETMDLQENRLRCETSTHVILSRINEKKKRKKPSHAFTIFYNYKDKENIKKC